MFEDFSFSSPSSARPPRLALDDDKPMTDCDAMISPLSSRCPSPRSFAAPAPRFPRSRSLYFRSPQHQQPQPPTSVPFSAYDSHRLSIGTLTKKLHEHTIQNPEIPSSPTSTSTTPTNPRSRSLSRFPGYVLTPPDTDLSDDGYPSPMSSPSTPQSPFLAPSPTSAPQKPLDAPDLTLQTYPDLADSTSIRTRRQHISRLQVQYTPHEMESIRRTLLSATGVADDDLRYALTQSCHPSSLPPSQGQGLRRKRGFSLRGSRVRSSMSPDGPTFASGDMQLRRKSVSVSTTATLATGAGRIEKSGRYQSSTERDRERKKSMSEAGLRRKSMVSAKLAEMIDNSV
ncbi:hypothetical protein BJY04DRAFT_195011 [Aspergillus karnatakaensis]|uniref:uncharacterized protein n=1 Tax=Aspergillus karnatakaensis TaxID=1810916 RepID=UPI003CCDB113